jgi:hypothetical protein
MLIVPVLHDVGHFAGHVVHPPLAVHIEQVGDRGYRHIISERARELPFRAEHEGADNRMQAITSYDQVEPARPLVLESYLDTVTVISDPSD